MLAWTRAKSMLEWTRAKSVVASTLPIGYWLLAVHVAHRPPSLSSELVTSRSRPLPGSRDCSVARVATCARVARVARVASVARVARIAGVARVARVAGVTHLVLAELRLA